MNFLQRVGLGLSNAAGNAADRFIEEDAKQQAANRQIDFLKVQDQLQQARDLRLSELRIGESRQLGAQATDEAVRAQGALMPGKLEERRQTGLIDNQTEAGKPVTYNGRKLDPTTGQVIDVRDPVDVALDRAKGEADIEYRKAGTKSIGEQGRRIDETNRAHLAGEAGKREKLLSDELRAAQKDAAAWLKDNPAPSPKSKTYKEDMDKWVREKGALDDSVKAAKSQLDQMRAPKQQGSVGQGDEMVTIRDPKTGGMKDVPFSSLSKAQQDAALRTKAQSSGAAQKEAPAEVGSDAPEKPMPFLKRVDAMRGVPEEILSAADEAEKRRSMLRLPQARPRDAGGIPSGILVGRGS